MKYSDCVACFSLRESEWEKQHVRFVAADLKI